MNPAPQQLYTPHRPVPIGLPVRVRIPSSEPEPSGPVVLYRCNNRRCPVDLVSLTLKYVAPQAEPPRLACPRCRGPLAFCCWSVLVYLTPWPPAGHCSRYPGG